ncbi:MAG: hypothetical protein GC161_11050 [Planctomycetaceae bacterium]|nr:hypothetical protein [Planctomycetaceae bacterium]
MANSTESADPTPKRSFGTRHRLALLLVVVVLLGSVALRAFAGEKAQPADPATLGAASLTAGGTAAEPETSDKLFAALPYLTEGSFFALIGFALGYASKKVVKVGLIVVALVFVALQGLVWADVAQVDWGAAVEKLNTLIFNVREDTSVGEWLRARVPSLGGLLAGYVLGFRRG